jgi:uncharacterized phage protein (TIGR02218 family)
MKTLSEALQTHLAQELCTLSTLIKITRRDNVVLGFTSHDRDLVVDEVTYRADTAFQASALENRNALSTDNLTILGLLDDAAITEEDIRASRYDHARVDVYLCNWADLTQGVMQLRRGWLGEIKITGGRYEAELRGLHDLLQRTIGPTFTPECRYDFGDTSCTLHLATFTVSGSITAVAGATSFYDSTRGEASAYFNGGLLTWTSGANEGLAMEVKSFDATQFTLWLPMPGSLTNGDAYTVYPGCDKRLTTCKTKFNNLINFGGFPYLPGLDKILDYPDARA